MEALIIGGGIGGLTLALLMHRDGLPCRVFEAAPEIRPLGVGINLLPHATRVLSGLGLEESLRAVAVETQENLFYNSHGQLIYGEPCGRRAGYDWPQFSIHRGDLQMVLVEAVRDRLGPDRVVTGHKCVGVAQEAGRVRASFEDPETGERLPEATGDMAIACDGFHSAVRAQFYPEEGPAVYAGINVWRGVTRARPFLSGASVARAGALKTGKFLIYPIRNDVDGRGGQLINWAAELESDTREPNDWNKPGRLEDFFHIFEGWRFDWLDIPALILNAELILEYPMVDRDPLPQWSFGRVTLMGDAAHPMYPRGSNGAAQAIIDAETLVGALQATDDPAAALKAYEAQRLEPTAEIVRTNRSMPPDTMISVVEARTGGRPFERLEDVISREELDAIAGNYRQVAGYSFDELKRRSAPGPGG